MQTMRWSLLFLVLLAPLSIGCGGSGTTAPVGSQDALEQYAAENPEAANEAVEDTFETEGAPN